MDKPKYIAIAAVTIDGKIAAHKDHMSDWTSPEDKKFMRALLAKCDVVIVGNNTYKTAVKPLSKRNCIVFTTQVASTKRVADNLLYVNPSKINFRNLIKQLGYKKIALLGGAQAYTYFLENHLLDEIYLTIEPLVFGTGVNLFSAEKFKDYQFKLLSVKKLNKTGSVLLRYARG